MTWDLVFASVEMAVFTAVMLVCCLAGLVDRGDR
jgi:hypothetical protein